MSEMPSVGAFAIVPSNDLAAAIPFWERMGFVRTGGDANVIMTGWGCEIHLTQAGTGPWRVPAEHNPFGVFIRTPDVEAIVTRVDDLLFLPVCCGIVIGACMRSESLDRMDCWFGWDGLLGTSYLPRRLRRKGQP